MGKMRTIDRFGNRPNGENGMLFFVFSMYYSILILMCQAIAFAFYNLFTIVNRTDLRNGAHRDMHGDMCDMTYRKRNRKGH